MGCEGVWGSCHMYMDMCMDMDMDMDMSISMSMSHGHGHVPREHVPGVPHQSSVGSLSEVECGLSVRPRHHAPCSDLRCGVASCVARRLRTGEWRAPRAAVQAPGSHT